MSKVFKQILAFTAVITAITPPLLAMAGPNSTNYELKDYTFGGGSTSDSDSTNYSIFATLGELDAGRPNSTSYKFGGGMVYTMMANVPAAPDISNTDNYYNKLKIIINNGNNASDAQFAIAISTDAFASDTKYVQSDNTVGVTLGSEDWQTYTLWGGSSGVNIIGLSPGTTYTVKVAARRGDYTQSGYSATDSAATVNPQLTFDIDVSSDGSDTNPPFSLSIGQLTPSTVITSSTKVWIDLSTNGTNGGSVYVYGSNTGLLSSHASYTISAVSADLAAANEGYGARSYSNTQSSGGPMRSVSPYTGASDNVGIVDANKRIIFDSTAAPVTSGRSAFEIKAKASSVTPAAPDYTDVLTVIASASF